MSHDQSGPVSSRKIRIPKNGAASAACAYYHTFWQNVVAAVISYAGMLNWWHPSYVEWQCIKADSGP